MKPRLLFLFLLSALSLACLPVVADDIWRALRGEVEAGRLLPLSTVLNRLEESYIGQVIEVEVEQEDGQIIYEIEMIGPEGQLVEFTVDAASGALIAIEGRNIRGMERR